MGVTPAPGRGRTAMRPSLLLVLVSASLGPALGLPLAGDPPGVAPAVVNCTETSTADFPEDIFSLEERRSGAVIFHLVVGYYCFLLTAYICNDYLLPALDCICAELRISTDVAGATFLATASCFPELFVNAIGTFITETDLGVGTVVGSAVFNTFVTPACGALFALKGIQLKWHILARDCIIYGLAVGVLFVVMWDNRVEWYEGLLLVFLFAIYFTTLFVNESITKVLKRICSRFGRTPEPTPPTLDAAISHENYTMPFGTYRPYFHGELIAEYRSSMCIKAAVNGEAHNPEKRESTQTDLPPEPESIFRLPKDDSWPALLWFLSTWPLKLALALTIPDARYKSRRHLYPLTFLMCVVWIAVSSYVVSWMTTIVGETLGISDSVMGMTFLAAGGNMPEMVSIVILSRQGHGDMAMSNTLGANTLDILLCLGVPWTIKALISGHPVNIISAGLVYSNLSIIVCVVGFFLVMASYNFVLNRRVGLVCLGMYALFLVFAIYVEINAPMDPPMCQTRPAT